MLISPEALAQICRNIVLRHEEELQVEAAAIVLMFGVDPASPWMVLYPIPLDDLKGSAEGGADLRSALNPAEHREELELSVPVGEGLLPGGEQLKNLLEHVVAALRVTFPDKLVCMTDPECTVLVESARAQAMPPALRFLCKLDAPA